MAGSFTLPCGGRFDQRPALPVVLPVKSHPITGVAELGSLVSGEVVSGEVISGEVISG
ncbi:MAG: hypothetical protein MUD04_09235 [Cyanobium sp. Prado107]|nr:hypothetical protein [Cyanobium sp. Prado107]